MKTKRLLAIFLTAALAALAGCGGPLDDDLTDNPDKPGPTPGGGDGAAYVIFRDGVIFPNKTEHANLFGATDKVVPAKQPPDGIWANCVQVWNDQGDGLGVTFDSSAEGHYKTKSMEMDTGSSDTYQASWRGICFWIDGPNSTSIASVKMWAYAEQATELSSFIGSDADHPAGEAEALSVPANSWTELSYNISASGISLYYFTLATGVDAGKIYIDDIRLIEK